MTKRTYWFDFIFREVGTIIHALGCFPSQADLQDFITEVRAMFRFCTYTL